MIFLSVIFGSVSLRRHGSEHLRRETEDFEIFELSLIERLQQVSLASYVKHEHPREFCRHHEGGGASGLSVDPSRDLCLICFEVQAHGPLDEPPDEEGKDEHEPQGLNAARRFEEQRIDESYIPRSQVAFEFSFSEE